MEGLYERTGKIPADLVSPEFPEDLRHLWEWHQQLRMGVRKMLTWADLLAWTIQMGMAPEPRECEALFYLDAIFRNPPKD